jgi:hypothetical protein
VAASRAAGWGNPAISKPHFRLCRNAPYSSSTCKISGGFRHIRGIFAFASSCEWGMTREAKITCMMGIDSHMDWHQGMNLDE